MHNDNTCFVCVLLQTSSATSSNVYLLIFAAPHLGQQVAVQFSLLWFPETSDKQIIIEKKTFGHANRYGKLKPLEVIGKTDKCLRDNLVTLKPGIKLKHLSAQRVDLPGERKQRRCIKKSNGLDDAAVIRSTPSPSVDNPPVAKH